jgi:single-strand DNA-binding protein
MGRLTAAPEIKTSQTGMSVVNFTIAIDRRPDKNGNKTADFIQCAAFGKTAEIISKYFSKGRMILVNGNLQNNNYTDSNGTNHYAMRVVVNNISFCGDSGNGNTNNNSGYQQNQSYGQNPQSMMQSANSMGIPTYQQQDGFGNIGDLSEFEEIISDGNPPF